MSAADEKELQIIHSLRELSEQDAETRRLVTAALGSLANELHGFEKNKAEVLNTEFRLIEQSLEDIKSRFTTTINLLIIVIALLFLVAGISLYAAFK